MMRFQPGTGHCRDKLKLDCPSGSEKKRIELIQGSLTYRDKRPHGFDAAAGGSELNTLIPRGWLAS